MTTPIRRQGSGYGLDALAGIPVHIDSAVPAGTCVLDADPAEPRRITMIRAASHEFVLTDTQSERIRDHYQAMNERAEQAIGAWNRLIEQIGNRS